ncbi:myosin heavy chain, partial [Cryptosporidium bovis]|uniref:myosin heavy chain n=1 Tax=Cryptosporidium bovis TaxID=310047 RepID=UPI00351A861E
MVTTSYYHTHSEYDDKKKRSKIIPLVKKEINAGNIHDKKYASYIQDTLADFQINALDAQKIALEKDRELKELREKQNAQELSLKYYEERCRKLENDIKETTMGLLYGKKEKEQEREIIRLSSEINNNIKERESLESNLRYYKDRDTYLNYELDLKQSELTRVSEELSSMTEHYNNTYSELEKCKFDLNKERDNGKYLDNQLNIKNNEILKYQKDLNLKENEINMLKDDVTKLNSVIEINKNEINNLQAQLKEKQSECINYSNRIREIEIEMRKNLDENEILIKDLNSQIVLTRNDLTKKVELINDLNNQISSLNSKLQDSTVKALENERIINQLKTESELMSLESDNLKTKIELIKEEKSSVEKEFQTVLIEKKKMDEEFREKLSKKNTALDEALTYRIESAIHTERELLQYKEKMDILEFEKKILKEKLDISDNNTKIKDDEIQQLKMTIQDLNSQNTKLERELYALQQSSRRESVENTFRSRAFSSDSKDNITSVSKDANKTIPESVSTQQPTPLVPSTTSSTKVGVISSTPKPKAKSVINKDSFIREFESNDINLDKKVESKAESVNIDNNLYKKIGGDIIESKSILGKDTTSDYLKINTKMEAKANLIPKSSLQPSDLSKNDLSTKPSNVAPKKNVPSKVSN